MVKNILAKLFQIYISYILQKKALLGKCLENLQLILIIIKTFIYIEI